MLNIFQAAKNTVTIIYFPFTEQLPPKLAY